MKLSKEINGVTCDSREVEPGFAFIAIQGTKRDGHNFIGDALARGASLIITEKPVIFETDVPIQMVVDGRIALAEIAAAINQYPSRYLKTIGITGTNGKTTSAYLIHYLLNQGGMGCGLIGTVDIDTGKQHLKANLTTPDTVKLQKYLREMVESGLKAVSMEVSSHGIELKRTYGIDYDLAIFTNITRDHFDFHLNFKNYVKIKKSFFLHLAADSIALINNDDPHASYILKDIKANVISYGVEKSAMIMVENIQRNNLKTFFDLVICTPLDSKYASLKPMRIPIEITMPGKHNIYNTLSACATGLLMGLSPEQVQKVSTFTGIWRRFNIIYNENFMVIDDCAHNPGSYTAVFKTVRDLQYHHLYIINAIRGNRGVQINHDNALTIASWVKLLPNVTLLTTNCGELVNTDDLVSTEEEANFLQTLEKEHVSFQHSDQLQPHFQTIFNLVKPGDLILLLGAHAMDQAGDLFIRDIHEKLVKSH